MVTKEERRVRKKRLWVRLDCQGVLHGSMNSFLTLEEQAVFIKLILMAEMYGETPGLISDNDGNPLPHEFIAYELHAPLEVLKSTLAKCIKKKSIRENSSGIELVNFNKYQFTEYDRQLPYRLAKKEQALQGELENPEFAHGHSIESIVAMLKGEDPKGKNVPERIKKVWLDELKSRGISLEG